MIGGVLLLRGGLAALAVRATRNGEFVVGYSGGRAPRPRRHEAASPGRPSRPVVPAQATAGVPEDPDRTRPMTPVDGPPAEKAVPAG
jgi:hypothetical protein